jgi:uncharacterized membrane protein YkvA (DUF1232 family)
MSEHNEFESAYSDDGFWDKLSRYAKKAGKEVVEKALLLYYAAQNEEAPTWAKAIITAALGYFIMPLDAVADLTPGIGFTDDLGVLALAIAVVTDFINDRVREQTAEKMDGWFSESSLADQTSSKNADASGSSDKGAS